MKEIKTFFFVLLTSLFLGKISYGQNGEIAVFSIEEVDGITFGYRIPSLLTTASGTILAFAERRVGLHDHAQNDIVLKRSTNNGKTWQKMQIIADYLGISHPVIFLNADG